MITTHLCKSAYFLPIIFSAFFASSLLSQTFERAYKDPAWATQFARVKQSGNFYYACGYVAGTNNNMKIYGDFSKIDLNGNILWTVRPFDSLPCRFFDFEETPNGEFIVVGRTEPATIGSSGQNNSSIVCRISPNGAVLYARSYEFSEGREGFFSIKRDADATGTYFISGARENPTQLGSTVDNVLIAEMNDAGQFVRVTEMDVSVPNSAEITDNEFFLKIDQTDGPTSVMWTCGVWRIGTSSTRYGLVTGISENDHSVVFPMQLDLGTVVQDILPEASSPLLRILGVGRHNGEAIFFAYYPQSTNGFLWSVKVPGQANFLKIVPATVPDHYYVLGREPGGSTAKYVVHYFNTSGNSPVIEWSKFFDEGETSFSDAGINVSSFNRLLYFDSRQGNPGGTGQEVFLTNFDAVLENCLAQTPIYPVSPVSLTRTVPVIEKVGLLEPDFTEHIDTVAYYGQRDLCEVDSLPCFTECFSNQTMVLKEQIRLSLGEAGIDRGNDITLDEDGNIYVVGRFSGTVDFGGETATSNGESDIFVAKYDANLGLAPGGLLTIGGTGKDEGAAIVIKDGTIYIAGSFSSDNVNFNPNGMPSTFSTNGNWDCFIAKYNSNFDLIHAVTFGGIWEDQIRDMTIDSKDGIIVTGKFRGSVNFVPLPVQNAGGYHAFIAKYDGLGAFEWVDHFGGEVGVQDDEGWGIIHDEGNNDDIYVTGEVQGTFVGENLTPGTLQNAFLAKYSSNGTAHWKYTLNQSSLMGTSVGFDVDIQDKFLYAVGHFSGGDIELDLHNQSGTLLTTANTDAYVVKYDITGANPSPPQAYFQIPDATAHAIKVDDNRVYLGGSFRNPNTDFDPHINMATLAHSGGDDVFVAKYEDLGPSFKFLDAETTTLGTPNRDVIYNIAIGCDTIYAVGDIDRDATTGMPDFYIGQFMCDCIVPTTEVSSNLVSLTLSPNPTTGRITLKIPENPLIDARLLLFDVYGRLVHTQTLPNAQETMEFYFENIPSGTYFVEIRERNINVWRGKVVKQ